MIKKDEAIELSNPRLLTGIYYGLLAIIATIMMDSLLFALGIEKILPIFKAILLAVIIASLSGALFGKRIVHSKKPFKTRVFLWGFFMVLVAMPIYDLGLVYLLIEAHPMQFAHANYNDILNLYLFVFIYSFIMAGVWLAILSGVAAIYLRGHVVYYILQSSYQQPERLHKDKIDSSNNTINKDHTL